MVRWEVFYPHTKAQQISSAGLLVVTVAAIVFMWSSSPGTVFQVKAAGEDVYYQGLSVAGMDIGVEDELVFQEGDVERLNQLWIERDHEVGFCGIVRGDGVVDLWMADTIEASESHIRFTWANCPLSGITPGEHRLMLHTHPGGTPKLSQVDKEVFIDSGFEYSCIQYDSVGTFRDTVTGLNCYSKDGVESVGDEFPQVDLQVEG